MLEGSVLIGGGLVFFVALIVLTVVADQIATGRERSRLAGLQRDPAIAAAMSELLLARDEFSKVVARYESVLASQPAAVALVGSGSSLTESTAQAQLDLEEQIAAISPGFRELVESRNVARERLFDAQRLWEVVRPGVGPDAAADLWFGSGLVRAWQIGPVGFERIFYRFDHAVDSSCWSIMESSRIRIGFGLGAERQSLALFVVGASGDQLARLSAMAFSGSEVALRPGFVPMRTWRRLRRTPEAKAANDSLLTGNTVDRLIEGPTTQTRLLVKQAFEIELGEQLNRTTSLPDCPSLISVITKGPSVLVGVWSGRTPEPELRAASGHGIWR